jgi:hypothetical protein
MSIAYTPKYAQKLAKVVRSLSAEALGLYQ